MRMVFNIAKAELRNLFYSPVAWFLLIAFIAQCGYFYTSVLSGYTNWQDIMIKNNPTYSGMEEASYTRILFLGSDGFFTNVMQNLFLFIPLLTMGLIGREVQNGTVKLLYSSPVKIPQIVLGKYLAILVYNLMLVLIVSIFMITAALNMIHVDYGMLLSALLGFFLLTCAYTAIGAFMSSLTTYQIVSAIGTFLVIITLSKIGYLWQKYDFVRDLTFFLFLPGRAEKMLVGLITTKDVIYFLVIIYMFLGFTILRLRAARESKPWFVRMMRYCFVMISGLLIGYVSSRPVLTGYWDTTEQDVNTLHEKTQKLIKEMGEEPLEVTLYVNQLGGGMQMGLPAARNAYLFNLWESYLRFKPDIRFNYVYYYDYDSTVQGGPGPFTSFPGKSLDYISGKMAELYEVDVDGWLKPHEIQKQIDLRPERLRIVLQLKYKGRTEFLRTFDDPIFWPSEFHVAAAFKRLLHPDFPRVGFITGHYERNIDKTGEREFRTHTAGKENRWALVNIGFDVDTINLDRVDIPANLSTLVLADPKSALSPGCMEKIRQYIDRGGNMFIMGEPGKQQMVNPVLKQIGANLMDGILVAQSKNEMPDFQQPFSTNAYMSICKDASGTDFKKVEGEHFHLVQQRVTAIDFSDTAGFINTPLLIAPPGVSWLKKGILVADSAMVQFSKQEGDVQLFRTLAKEPEPAHKDTAKAGHEEPDQKGAFVTILGMHRTVHNKDQRILVSGDADFMSNLRVGQHKLIFPLYSWLENAAYPIYMFRPDPPDKLLTITLKTAELLELIYVWILPGLVLLAGTILLIRRKRK